MFRKLRHSINVASTPVGAREKSIFEEDSIYVELDMAWSILKAARNQLSANDRGGSPEYAFVWDATEYVARQVTKRFRYLLERRVEDATKDGRDE